MVRDVMDLAQILRKLLPTANNTAEQSTPSWSQGGRKCSNNRTPKTLEANLACIWRSAETFGRDLCVEWKRCEEENAQRDVEHKVERGRAHKEVEDLCICRICGYCVHVIFVF